MGFKATPIDTPPPMFSKRRSGMSVTWSCPAIMSSHRRHRSQSCLSRTTKYDVYQSKKKEGFASCLVGSSGSSKKSKKSSTSCSIDKAAKKCKPKKKKKQKKQKSVSCGPPKKKKKSSKTKANKQCEGVTYKIKGAFMCLIKDFTYILKCIVLFIYCGMKYLTGDLIMKICCILEQLNAKLWCLMERVNHMLMRNKKKCK